MNDLEKYLDIDYSKLPPYLIADLKAYIENGVLPGEFLQAVLTNNLVTTVRHSEFAAWTMTISRFLELINFLGEKAPTYCWGSPEIMELWKARRGIRG